MVMHDRLIAYENERGNDISEAKGILTLPPSKM